MKAAGYLAAGEGENAGAADAGKNGGGAGNDGGGGDEKLFNESEVENIVKSRLARDRSDVRRENESLKTQLKDVGAMRERLEELEALENKRNEEKMSVEERLRAKHERELGEWQGKYKDLEGRYSSTEQKFMDYRRTVAVTNAAVKLNAIAPDQVVALVRDRVKFVEDDEKKGDPQMVFVDDKGVEITIEEGVKSFLEDNLHLVKNVGGAGGGARGGNVRGKGKLTAEMIQAMTPAERKERKTEINEYLANQQRGNR